jgi:hypothetical protein
MTIGVAAERCPVHEGFDPLSPLGEAPVFFAPSIGYQVVTRHADVEQVFRGPQTLMVRRG